MGTIVSWTTVKLLALTYFGASFLNKLVVSHRLSKAVKDQPGVWYLFSFFHFWTRFFFDIPGISLGSNWPTRLGHKFFAKQGWDVLSFVTVLPTPRAGYMVADPVAVREITTNHARFYKPMNGYDVLKFYGPNILVTEGREWKKHRKVAAPTFSDRNNKLVWDETIRLVNELMDHWGRNKAEVLVENANDITMQLALMVISVAGFGRRMTWERDLNVPLGHTMNFSDALHYLSDNIFYKLVAPKWAYSVSKKLQKLQQSYDELQLYMEEMVVERRTNRHDERYDLFSALLDGNMDDVDDKLENEELIGNIFIFLIAGHETTGHTLAFALGLLAIEQEEQERLYQEIKSVVPDGEMPGYEKISLFPRSLAVLYETLRLYSSVPNIPKVATEDTLLPVTKPDGSVVTIPVQKGMPISLNTAALHRNSRYWNDPETFNPSRFLDDYPKDAFIPFSGGPRACLGRRFAESESVVFLSMLVMNYKITLKDAKVYDGLTTFQIRQKVLVSKSGLTTTPIKVPLIFQKRV